MKTFVSRILIAFCLFCTSHFSNAQLPGIFNYGNDGHIYFFLTNNSNNHVPVRVTAQNRQKGEQRTAEAKILPGNVFYFGPNYGWIWEQGETMTVTYGNGQSYNWACPATDPAAQNSSNGGRQDMSNHPYKCEFCNGKGTDIMGGVCAICGGRGWAKMSGTGGGGRSETNGYSCGTCRGTGKCISCHGLGTHSKGYGVGQMNCGQCAGKLSNGRGDGRCRYCNGTGRR